jgi:hypothetical protein
MQWRSDERVRQVAIGVTILIVLGVSVVGLLVGWRSLPGLLGEWIGFMLGVMTTPFFLEASFAIIGLLVVLCLNIWRRHKEGEELVYLEQLEGPDVPENVPDQAKWAVFRDRPLEVTPPSLLTQAEGAFELGDYETTAEWIAEMDQEELRQPDALRLRHHLAMATGKQELARQLEQDLRNL